VQRREWEKQLRREDGNGLTIVFFKEEKKKERAMRS